MRKPLSGPASLSLSVLLFCSFFLLIFISAELSSGSAAFAAGQSGPSPSPASPAHTPSPASPPQPSPSPASLPQTPAAQPSASPQSSASPQPSGSPGAKSEPSPAPSPAAAEEDESPYSAVYRSMKNANRGLADYSVPLTMKVKVKYSLLEIPINLEGMYYYKEPDKHKLKVNKAPSYLSKYPQIFGWSLPDPKDFTSRIAECPDGNRECMLVKLIPIMGKGDLLKVEMWVNKTSFLSPRQVYHYRDGGKITLELTYRTINSFHLFDQVQSSLEFPRMSLNARADALYGDYSINKGLDDSIFTEK